MPASPIRLAIAGAGGRMGRMLIEAALADTAFRLTVALDRSDSADLGHDCAAFLGRASGITISADPQALTRADVLIDFTRPAASLTYLDACVTAGCRHVIGTTGFDAAGKAAISAAARRIGVVFAPNMSVGVNAAFKLIETAARILGADYDVEIIEAHHRHKVDAPSGTALQMGELVARARGQALDAVGVYQRHGDTGARTTGGIGFSAIRGGDIVGDHTVLFAGSGERIEITHRSASRATYAQGALRAARFLVDRAPGLYDMNDVLGLAAAA